MARGPQDTGSAVAVPHWVCVGFCFYFVLFFFLFKGFWLENHKHPTNYVSQLACCFSSQKAPLLELAFRFSSLARECLFVGVALQEVLKEEPSKYLWLTATKIYNFCNISSSR